MKYIYNSYQAQQQQLLQTPQSLLQPLQQQNNYSEVSANEIMNNSTEPRIDDLILHPTLTDYYNSKYTRIFIQP